MQADLHMLAYRNTFLANDEGRYVLWHLLARLGFFDPCKTPEDVPKRNVALELLENCGILFVAHATPENAESSTRAFVEAIAGLDVGPLVDAQQETMSKQAKEDIL